MITEKQLEELRNKIPNDRHNWMNKHSDEIFNTLRALFVVLRAAESIMKVLPVCKEGFDDGCPWCFMSKSLAPFRGDK